MGQELNCSGSGAGVEMDNPGLLGVGGDGATTLG